MSILQYFKPTTNGLPDPRGPLSRSLPSSVIASANEEVQNLTLSDKTKRKRSRGSYNQYSPETRALMAKYVAHHGISRAAGYFSRKLGVHISTSTLQYIRDCYIRELNKKQAQEEDDDPITSLLLRKRGRRLMIGEVVDSKVQAYLKKVREAGGVVTARVAVAAARGILKASNRSSLIEFGGHIDLDCSWGYSLLQRMNYVRRKATTSKSKFTPEEFSTLKSNFLSDVVSIVEMEEIPAPLILNWDQSGLKIIPSSQWSMDQKGAKRVEAVGISDKRLITAVFCGSLVGDFLPVQVIYKGKTSRCHPKYAFPGDWNISHSPHHWSTESTMLEYISEIILPFISSQRQLYGEPESKAALVIMDNFKGQITPKVSEILEQNNIHVALLPPNTTDRLQPMDLSINKPVKDYLRREFEDWYASQINDQIQGDIEFAELKPVDLSMPVMRELSAKWLVGAVEYIKNNPSLVVNGFLHSGIIDALDRKDETDDDAINSEAEDKMYTDEEELESCTDYEDFDNSAE